jgi:DNA polymerase-3 subunit delta'
MLLLIANVPGRLLPTTRSRCQRLDLRPLQTDSVEAELKTLSPDLDSKGRAAIARLSGGSIGMALQLASGKGVSLAAEADKLLEQSSNPDVPALLSFVDKLNRMTDGLDNFGAFLTQALMDRIRARTATNPVKLDRWVDAWEKLNHGFARAAGLHLDPRQTLLSAARTMNDTARRAGLL